MNPLQIIALADAALAVAEKAEDLFAEAKKEGLVTDAEQQAQHAEYEARKARLKERLGKS